MSYTIDWVGNDVFLKATGELNLHELHEANSLIYGDIRFDSMKFQLVDYIDVSSVNLTKGELQEVTALERSSTIWNKSVKVAFIAVDQYLIELINEYMKGMQKTKWSFMIFDNTIDAKKWCNR